MLPTRITGWRAGALTTPNLLAVPSVTAAGGSTTQTLPGLAQAAMPAARSWVTTCRWEQQARSQHQGVQGVLSAAGASTKQQHGRRKRAGHTCWARMALRRAMFVRPRRPSCLTRSLQRAAASSASPRHEWALQRQCSAARAADVAVAVQQQQQPGQAPRRCTHQAASAMRPSRLQTMVGSKPPMYCWYLQAT